MEALKKHVKKANEKLTYEAFLVCFDLCSKECQNDMLDVLHAQERPEKLCGKDVPKDLNRISYGMLDDIKATAGGSTDPIAACAELLIGCKQADVYAEDVNKVFGFNNFIVSELTRINKMFESIKIAHSPQEVAAGVEKLDFGSFGFLDWYARRMGITNQNEVREVAWVRLWQCMKNDNEQYLYEKRLREQYNKQSRIHKH